MAANNEILNSLSLVVNAAVASNMQAADTMREENNGKLSEEQGKHLHDIAVEMIKKSLPDSLTNVGGTLMNIVGGKEQLDTIVDTLIEKNVVENKGNNITKEIAKNVAGNIISNNLPTGVGGLVNNLIKTKSVG